jgi:hypothetical protein
MIIMTKSAIRKDVSITETIVTGQASFVLLYYAFSISGIFLLNEWSPSGPCTPGMGLMAFFIFITVSIGILLYNLLNIFIKDKSYLLPTVLHIIGLAVVFCLFW